MRLRVRHLTASTRILQSSRDFSLRVPSIQPSATWPPLRRQIRIHTFRDYVVPAHGLRRPLPRVRSRGNVPVRAGPGVHAAGCSEGAPGRSARRSSGSNGPSSFRQAVMAPTIARCSTPSPQRRPLSRRRDRGRVFERRRLCRAARRRDHGASGSISSSILAACPTWTCSTASFNGSSRLAGIWSFTSMRLISSNFPAFFDRFPCRSSSITWAGSKPARVWTQPAFRALLDLMQAGELLGEGVRRRARFDSRPAVSRCDTLCAAAHRAAPDRVLWGTDWPHPNVGRHMPNDGDLVDLVPLMAPDEASGTSCSSRIPPDCTIGSDGDTHAGMSLAGQHEAEAAFSFVARHLKTLESPAACSESEGRRSSTAA